MTAIDGTGLHALEHLADTLHDTGPALLLCGMRDQPARMLQRAEFHQHIRHAAVGADSPARGVQGRARAKPCRVRRFPTREPRGRTGLCLSPRIQASWHSAKSQWPDRPKRPGR